MNTAHPAEAPVGTAARLASGTVAVLAPGEHVAQVWRRLLGRRHATARDLPVCDPEGRVVGVARIEDLLAADPGQIVDAIMDPDPPTLTADADEAVAAWHAVRHGESSLVVVDADGRLVGVVPPDRLLDALLRAHESDVARIGGFLAARDASEHASLESVGRRLAHRLPWLLVGLAGALAAAGLMGGFEARLRESLTLALFVPGIVYLADAVGTQTETLLIRGLAAGVRVRDVAARELLTGALAGLLLGALFLPIGLLIWGEPAVVVTVALAMAAACTTANAVAMLLPAALARLGLDPAFGAGPVATVIQDLLSISIYLGLAIALTA